MQRQTLFGIFLLVYSGPLLHADEPADQSPYRSVACEGTYTHHLQGICADKDALYWSFTTRLVKTDLNGKVLMNVPVANHHGDLCFHEGKLYVAVNLGKFDDPEGNADSWVYVYNADDLAEIARHATPEAFYGAGGIAQREGRFFVVGGLPSGIDENYVYEYSKDFAFVKKHVVKSGHTHLGIQTATFADGHFWFGCYGDPKVLLKTDAAFQNVERYEFDCSLGIETIGGGRFLVGRGSCDKTTGCVGKIVLATSSPESGLAVSRREPESAGRHLLAFRPKVE